MADVSEDIEKAARLIVEASHVLALVGAGMSVESEIPPFRGPGGLWTKYGEPDMRGYDRFISDPKGWWESILSRQGYARELAEGIAQAKPNPGHYALAELEEMGVLKHIITQNVDNLHYAAGSKNVAEIHGNIHKLRCVSCGRRFERDEISMEVIPPLCPQCNGYIKTDGVMFGEPIPPDVLQRCEDETEKCDCMLLLGTSAQVYPAAAFPSFVRRKGGSLIEVNPYETALTGSCHVVIRGQTGEALPLLVERIRSLKG